MNWSNRIVVFISKLSLFLVLSHAWSPDCVFAQSHKKSLVGNNIKKHRASKRTLMEGGFSELRGIDEDDNRVRDDIDSIIRKRLSDRESRKYMLRVARMYERLYLDADDKRKSRLNGEELFKSMNCLDLIKGQDAINTFFILELEPEILNTPLRKSRAVNAMKNYSGFNFKHMKGAELRRYCDRVD